MDSTGFEGAQSYAEKAIVSGVVFSSPTITSFTPSVGPIGTIVTITGTKFNSISANNVVYFGAVKAQVQSASSTQLTVIVPVGTTYKPITVTDITTGLTAYSKKPFLITFSSSHMIDGTTFSRVDLNSNVGPNLIIHDFDGDGKPDIGTTNSNFRVFRNTCTVGSISINSFTS